MFELEFASQEATWSQLLPYLPVLHICRARSNDNTPPPCSFYSQKQQYCVIKDSRLWLHLTKEESEVKCSLAKPPAGTNASAIVKGYKVTVESWGMGQLL
jgi:hypothetical protein